MRLISQLKFMKRARRQLVAAVVAVFTLSFGGVLTANDYNFGERSLFSERAVAERLQSTGSVCVDGEDCGASVSEAGAPGVQVASSPEDVYSSKCLACHATGAAGAPKTGDVAEWQARLDDKGLDMLVSNAIGGIGLMPAKGTCMDCSDDTIKAVVEYMLAQSK